MTIILEELVKFIKKDRWIFILLIIALLIVNITWRWNIYEIIILFLANFLWNLFIMIMQSCYTQWKDKMWAINQLLASLVFTTISLYWLIIIKESQYIIWQIAYLFASIKTFSFFYYKKQINFFTEKTFIILNLILFIIFILFFHYEYYSIIQSIWFCLITTWLVSIIDKNRYWLNIIWIWLLVFWSLLWVIYSYYDWNFDWLAFWYFTLTSTVFIYYIKLLKNYI